MSLLNLHKRRISRAVPLPSAITNLAITGTTETSISMEWSASQNAQYYTVNRRSLPDGSWNKVSANITATGFTNSGLSGGRDYEYQVFAHNETGSTGSNIVAASTVLPSPAVPLNFNAQAQSPTSVLVSWEPVEYAEEYLVEMDGAVTAVMGQASSQILYENLTPGQTYQFRMRAWNSSGYSQYTDSISVTLESGVPTAPQNLHTTDKTQTSISMAWTAGTDVDFYSVNRRTVGGVWSSVGNNITGTTFTNSGLTAGTTYEYQVVAHNQYGTAHSNILTETTVLPIPQPPQNLDAVAMSESSIKVTWEASEFADSYLLEIDGSVTEVFATEYTYTGLSAGQSYNFRARARNASGISQYSNSDTESTQTGLPAAPTNIQFTNIATTSVTVNWDAASGADYYQLFRRIQGDTSWAQNINNITGTAITNNGIASDTTHEYMIRAHNANGYADSGIYQVKTLQRQPTAPVLSIGAVGTNSIQISWTESADAENYKLQVSQGSWVTEANTTNLSYTFAAQPDTQYSFRVIAENSAGTATSNTETVTTQSDVAPAVAPNDLVATGSSQGDIWLSWTRGTDIDYIYVQYKLRSQTNWTTDTATPYSGTQDFANTPYGSGWAFGDYDFRLQAHGLDGSVVYSNIAQVSIVEDAPVYDNPETLTFMDTQNIPDDTAASPYPNKTNRDLWYLFDEVVSYLKANGEWGNIHHWHPMLGAGAVERGYNAIDINSYYMTFHGSWIFTTLGNKGNGTNTYSSWGFISRDFPLEDFGMSINVIEEGTVDSCDIGGITDSQNNARAFLKFNGKLYVYLGGALSVNNSTRKGRYTMTRSAGMVQVLKNGNVILNQAGTGNNLSVEPSYYGAVKNNTGDTLHGDATYSDVMHHTGGNPAVIHEAMRMWNAGLGRI